jgi:hypothetical protein
MIAALHYARQDIAQLRLVIHEFQQGGAAGAAGTDSQDIFGGRIEAKD